MTVELVPKPLWGQNPRSAMTNRQWDDVRRKVYADAGHRCEICGAEGKLQAHEVWEYDDEKFIQRLIRMIALCPSCHGVKHFGRSALVLREDDKMRIYKHFVAVNGCSREEFAKHLRAELAKYQSRSKHADWKIDWGPFQKFDALARKIVRVPKARD